MEDITQEVGDPRKQKSCVYIIIIIIDLFYNIKF